MYLLVDKVYGDLMRDPSQYVLGTRKFDGFFGLEIIYKQRSKRKISICKYSGLVLLNQLPRSQELRKIIKSDSLNCQIKFHGFIDGSLSIP